MGTSRIPQSAIIARLLDASGHASDVQGQVKKCALDVGDLDEKLELEKLYAEALALAEKISSVHDWMSRRHVDRLAALAVSGKDKPL